MKKQPLSKIILTSVIFVVSSLAVSFVFAWQPPTQEPPGANTEKPINTGTDPQAKSGVISATQFTDFPLSTYYFNPSGDSRPFSITIAGETMAPSPADCADSSRGKLYLFEGASGQKDELYVCAKQADESYGWITFDKPQKGANTTTTRIGDFQNTVAYEIGTGSGAALTYCIESWLPLWPSLPSFQRFCEERGQVYVAYAMDYPMSLSGASGKFSYYTPKCRWKGDYWDYDYEYIYSWPGEPPHFGDGYLYGGWLWCEETPD